MMRYSDRDKLTVYFTARITVIDQKTFVRVKEDRDDQTLGRFTGLGLSLWLFQLLVRVYTREIIGEREIGARIIVLSRLIILHFKSVLFLLFLRQ